MRAADGRTRSRQSTIANPSIANRQSPILRSAIGIRQPTIDLGLSNRPRLRAGDEGFGDDAWIAGGGHIARRFVDGDEDDVAGRLELGRILSVPDPRLEDLDPDRHG